MTRSVLITGLGPVSGLGIGIDANWAGVLEGRSAIAPITAFDPAGFDCRVAAEVKDFKIAHFVPKTYRKATKVMARDIELAVAAADLASRDAGLVTKGNATDPAAKMSYPSSRMGANIGASLIACELDELTPALVESRGDDGSFDIHKWGEHGMQQLTPLWLLKYLPNMLACHVTIIHDAQGPSNTITCAEASSALSIGEALRVIQRGAADVSFCGGAESKLNPMAYLRQQMLGRLSTTCNDNPASGPRPFNTDADGTLAGEGGGIVILEAADTFARRVEAAKQSGGAPPRAYCRIMGFGASQTVNIANQNRTPDPEGKAIELAIRAALKDANISADAVDVVFPFGTGEAAFDVAEAAAMSRVFGNRLAKLPVVSIKPLVGSCGAASGALDVCIAAKSIAKQTVPPVVNRGKPIAGLAGNSASTSASIHHALVFTTSLGGQNAAMVLGKA